jgi:hypothetical protein
MKPFTNLSDHQTVLQVNENHPLKQSGGYRAAAASDTCLEEQAANS